jgi:hypothetical protein
LTRSSRAAASTREGGSEELLELRLILFDFDDALLQLADPGLELLDELTECATVGLKGGVARYAG